MSVPPGLVTGIIKSSPLRVHVGELRSNAVESTTSREMTTQSLLSSRRWGAAGAGGNGRKHALVLRDGIGTAFARQPLRFVARGNGRKHALVLRGGGGTAFAR